MFRTARRTAALTIAATGIAVLAGVGVASAHIQTDPPAIEAGTQVTLGFIVEHGCADANTTGLDVKLPDGATGATAAEDGWQVAVTDGVVRFSGGNQDAHTSKTFHIAFTAPTTPGAALFPTVQHCGETDTSWLDVQAAGAAEPEHPAPLVKVTQGPPTSDDLVIPTDDDSDEDATATSATTGDAGGAATSPTAAPAVTVTAPASSTSDDDSNTGVIVVVIVVLLGAALGVAGIVVTKRRRSSGPGHGPTGPTGV